jgi:RIO-like serine/threonine protein kinase
VSDNIFDWLRRLVEIEILIHENRTQIIEKLHSQSREGLMRDLSRLREAFQHATSELVRAEERLRDLMRSASQSAPEREPSAPK